MDGKAVIVRGEFRGANLFADMPAGTQLSPGDWVLRDPPFAVWVTGKPPRGEGFSLDPRSRADTRWRLEVEGTAKARDGFVYLRAKRIRLVGHTPTGDP
jgi:hypothetical protein